MRGFFSRARFPAAVFLRANAPGHPRVTGASSVLGSTDQDEAYVLQRRLRLERTKSNKELRHYFSARTSSSHVKCDATRPRPWTPSSSSPSLDGDTRQQCKNVPRRLTTTTTTTATFFLLGQTGLTENSTHSVCNNTQVASRTRRRRG